MDSSYNNSFDSSMQGGVGTPISSGTGDIVLGGAPENKSKKWPIVVMILLLIVAAGLAVAYFVLKPGGGLNGGGTPTVYKSDFNKYANYIIYGKEDTVAVPSDLDSLETYYFDGKMMESDLKEKTALVNKTGELFDAFLTKYGNYDGEASEQESSSSQGILNSYVGETKDLIDFMKVVYVKDAITVDMINQFYIAGGDEQALVDVQGYYDFEGLENNSFAEEFSSILDPLADLVVSELDTYKNAGCLVEGVTSDECLLQAAGQEALDNVNALKAEIDEAYYELEYYYDLSSNLVLKTLVMNAAINDGDISNYVTVGGDDE